MTIHIGYDREEDKIELILASQGNVISTLDAITKETGFLFPTYTRIFLSTWTKLFENSRTT